MAKHRPPPESQRDYRPLPKFFEDHPKLRRLGKAWNIARKPFGWKEGGLLGILLTRIEHLPKSIKLVRGEVKAHRSRRSAEAHELTTLRALQAIDTTTQGLVDGAADYHAAMPENPARWTAGYRAGLRAMREPRILSVADLTDQDFALGHAAGRVRAPLDPHRTGYHAGCEHGAHLASAGSPGMSQPQRTARLRQAAAELHAQLATDQQQTSPTNTYDQFEPIRERSAHHHRGG